MPLAINSTKYATAHGETVIATLNTWQQLTTTPVSCSRVLISAPSALNTKGAANTGSVLIKLSSQYNASNGGIVSLAPSDRNGGFTLPNTSTGITYFNVADPSLIWIYGTAADAVEWTAEQ